MQLQHLFSETDFCSSHQPTDLHKGGHYAAFVFGFLLISRYICRHHRDCVIEPIWGLYFGNGRWVSWPKLFQSSEARKATKCLLCCWSAAQFFSYVNAVICRWMWWILTSRKTSNFTSWREARVRAVTRSPKLRTLPLPGARRCVKRRAAPVDVY